MINEIKNCATHCNRDHTGDQQTAFDQWKSGVRMLAMPMTALAVAVSLSACSGDDGEDGQPGADGAAGLPAATFLVAKNGSTNTGMLDTIDQNGAVASSFSTGANEGVVLDRSGHLTQASDLNDEHALRFVCSAQARGNAGMFSSDRDRELAGVSTGLLNPKGIALAPQAGLVMVANFNATLISVFGSSAGGDATPVATSALAVKPWDLDYDETRDRLFIALTDGSIGVIDNYVANGFSGNLDRTIIPADSGGTQISVNSHGIVYDAAGNRLIVSDVGDAALADDGAIFVISDASSADGLVSVDRQISGPETMLGNPVDIVLSGSDLRVAEKSNDAILVFRNIFNGASGDVAPELVTSATKPESLVEVSAALAAADTSDTTDRSTIRGLLASSNPSVAGPTSGQISRLTTSLASEVASYDTSLGLESVTLDRLGDVYATYDDGTDGGILIANRVATQRDGEAFTPSRDRVITGSNTGLVAPKGLDIASELGLVFVADVDAGSPAIRVFSSCASGDVAPLLTLNISAGQQPWDVDYDPESDRAFVSLTNGQVAVFDQVYTQWRSGSSNIAAESRLIQPAVSGVAIAAPTNLHGIDYDPVSDSLLVSDVADPASAADGSLYVLPGAAAASGLTDISVRISGASTNLGNPVDLTFDGEHAYVAEKSNSAVLRFDNILLSPGGDLAPSASIALTSAESVALIPAHVNQP